MTDYNEARARVAAFLDALGWGDDNDGGIIAQHGLHDLRFEDVALLVKVPEPPVVNVPPQLQPLLERSMAASLTRDPLSVVLNLSSAISMLEGRIQALENPPADLPRVSFVHDAGCPAGGHSPAIVRGYDGCTCKVGP